MIYSWECQQCQQVTEVTRKVADIDVGPEGGCECGGKELKRVILPRNNGLKGFILEGRGWHDDLYTKNRSRN